MKNLYNSACCLNDNNIIKLKPQNDYQRNIPVLTDCPPAWYAKKAVMRISAFLNPDSKYHKSEDILNAFISDLESAVKLVDKGSYDQQEFCLSVIHISYVFRLICTYSSVFNKIDNRFLTDIKQKCLLYMGHAKKLIVNFKLENIYAHAALLHIDKDTQDNFFDISHITTDSYAMHMKTLSPNDLFILCDMFEETGNVNILKIVHEKMKAVILLTEPDNHVINPVREKLNLRHKEPEYTLYDYSAPLFMLFKRLDTNILKNTAHTVCEIQFDSHIEKSTAHLIPALKLLYDKSEHYKDKHLEFSSNDKSKNKVLNDAGIYRFNAGSYVTSTVFENQDLFYSLQVGKLKVRLRMNATFFGPKGRFEGKLVELTKDTIKIAYQRQWGYFLPLTDRSIEPIVGADINKDDRDMTLLQHIYMTAEIRMIKDGADITISATGTDDLAFKVDFIFEKHGLFTCDHATIHANGNDFIQLQKGSFTYSLENDYITVLQAFDGRSIYSESLRGSHPPIDDTFTVYFTDMTPVTKTIRITGGTK